MTTNCAAVRWLLPALGYGAVLILFSFPRFAHSAGNLVAFGKWERVTDNVMAADLRSLCAFSSRLVLAVGTTGVVERTTNQGLTWFARRIDSSVTLLSVAAYDSLHGAAVGDGGSIFITSDGGANWTKQVSRTNKTLRSVAFFAPVLGGIQVVAVGDSGTIVTSGDGGRHWDRIDISILDPLVTTADSFSAVVISNDGSSGVAVASNGHSVRLYAVNGTLGFAFGGSLQQGVTQLQCSASGMMWAGGGNWTISTSTDRGETWTRRWVDSIAGRLHSPRGAFFGLSSTGTGFFVVPRYVGDGFRALYISTDGGHTWQLSPDSVSTDIVSGAQFLMPPAGRASAFLDSARVVVCGDRGWLVASSDAGNSWSLSAYCPMCSAKQISGVRFADENAAFLTCTFGQRVNAIQHSTDAGWNWATQYVDSTQEGNNAVVFRSLAVPDPSECIAVQDSGYVVRTSDGGRSWERKQYFSPVGSQSLGRISMYDIQHGYMSSASSLYETADGGRTFSAIVLPSWLEGTSIIDIAALTRGSCALLISSGIGIRTFVRYVKGASMWWADSEVFRRFRPISSISFLDSLHGWAVGGDSLRSKIVRTTDGGISWTLVRDTLEDLPFGIVDAIVVNGVAFANAYNGIASGLSNLLLRTTDGGMHWVRQDDGINTLANYNSREIAFPSLKVAAVPGSGFLLRYDGDQTTGVKRVDGLIPFDANQHLMTFPSPAVSTLNIVIPNAGDASVLVTDILGRNVLDCHVVCVNELEQYAINLSSLETGRYIVTVIQGTKRHTCLIITHH